MKEQQRIIEEQLEAKRKIAKSNGNLGYDKRYDAFYDKETDEWLESACDNADCIYCRNRPSKHTL